MELRTLRYFLTVAREGSISAAAEALHLTQPTLSRQLMELESELGAPLFIRGRRNHGLELTEQGLLLRQRASELLELAEKTTRELQQSPETVSGDLYIGGGESESMRTVVWALKSLQQRYPRIRSHLFSGNAEAVMERLDRGLLDFGVVIDPAELRKYHSLRLPIPDRFGLLLRRDHPLAQQTGIYAEDLNDLPLLISQQSRVQNFVSDWCRIPPERLRIMGTYTLIYNASLMVEEGMGCALCLERLVNTTGDSVLCFRPFEPQLTTNLNVIWKQNSTLSVPAQIFLRELEAACAAEKKVL